MRRATLPSERRPALLRAFGWMRLHRKTRSHKQTHTRDALAPIPDPSTHLARPKPCATSSWVAPASCAGTQACFLYTMSSKPPRRSHLRPCRAERFALFTRTVCWWSLSGSNRRPEACKATALPAELRPRYQNGVVRRISNLQPTPPNTVNGGPGKI